MTPAPTPPSRRALASGAALAAVAALAALAGASGPGTTSAAVTARAASNPSFESGTAGWRGLSASVTRVVLTGSAARRPVARIARTGGLRYGIASRGGLVRTTSLGASYKGSAFVRATGSGTVGKVVVLLIVERRRGGAVVRRTAAARGLSRSWRPLTATHVVRTRGTQLELRLVQRSAGRGAAFYADDLALTRVVARPVVPTITSASPSSASTAAEARIAFTSSRPPGRHECSLDGAAFTPCASPIAYAGLAPGPHDFLVRGVTRGVAGDPASHGWVVQPAVPPDARAGVNAHLLNYPRAERRATLAATKGLVVRESIGWGGGDDPATWPSWPLVDVFASDVQDAGARLLPVLEPGVGRALDADGWRRYAAWAREFCERYRPPLIEIDNEPWNAGEWSASPEEYATEVRAVAAALEGAPCRALVSADLYRWDGPVWAAPLFAADPELWRRPEIAGWSVHPYTSPFSPDTTELPERWSFTRYRSVLAIADKYAPGKPAYLTELGWSTQGEQEVSDGEQATFVDRALTLADSDPRVALTVVYKLHASPADSTDEEGFALTRPDGGAKSALAVLAARAP